MPDLRRTALLDKCNLRATFILILFCLTVTSGCKISDDVAAAGTQLTSTASTLTSYYSALDTLLSDTDQLYQVQAVVNPLAPYDAQTKSYVADIAAEIAKREKLAVALTTSHRSSQNLVGRQPRRTHPRRPGTWNRQWLL